MPSKRASSAPTVVLARPPQRRQIHPLQPHHQLPPRDRHGDCRDDPRRELAARRVAGRELPPGRYRRDVRRQRGSASRARRGAGPEGAEGGRCPCFRGRWPRRAGLGRRGDCRRAAGPRPRRSSWRSTRPTTSGRGAGRVEFYQLGFDPVVEIAAEHGEGVGDLLDEITARCPARRDGASRRSPRRKPPSPSSAGRTSGSPRCSTSC